jgi:diguanylate cyclase (GGDEF)-like protein
VDYRRAVRFCAGLAAVCLAVTPIAAVSLGPSYPLFAMVLSAAITATAITALLLLFQAAMLRVVAEGVLGTGFALVAATMLPYTILYPGIFPGLSALIGARPAAHEYLWFTWQALLLVAVLVYQRFRLETEATATVRARARAATLGLVFAYAAIAVTAIWLPGVPPVFSRETTTPLYSIVVAPVLLLLAAAVIVETVRRRATANGLDAAIAIVATGVIAEVYLNAVGVTRFTIGWYGSRVVALLTTTVVLAVLLVRAMRAYGALIERAEVLEGEAHTDTLTGLPNRRRFDEEFARAFGSAIRRSSPIALAIVDIDHFKQYNDAFGHQAGDTALRRIAEAIAESVGRSGDFAARYGGEEFVIILEDTTLTGAKGVGERIRHAVIDAAIESAAGTPLTVSVGVAARLPGSDADELLRQADAALYQAKNAGRNRVAAWRSPTVAPIGSAFDDSP